MQIPAGALAYHFMKGNLTTKEAGFTVKRGAEILAGPYPKCFVDFIGQTTARTQIMAAIKSAALRHAPMDHMLLASGSPGIGKGHPLDTNILTPQGWREIGALIVGDQVIGSQGVATEVTGVFDRGVLPTYRVDFSDGSSTLCDADHLWTVQQITGRSHGQFKTLSTQRIMDQGPTHKGHARYSIPLVEPVEHDKCDLPVEPYLLGVLLANGHLSTSGIIIRTNDVEIIDRIRQRNPQVQINETTSPSSTARGWSVLKFRDVLRSIGLFQQRSFDKFVPLTYLTADVESRRELLRGLMDCDGSPRTDKGNPGYFTESPNLAFAVRYLVESLGGTGHISNHTKRGGQEHRVAIALAEPTFTLARKASLEHQGKAVRTIRSITPAGSSEIRCIKVAAKDSLYVTERFVVTHNTALGRLAASTLGKGFLELGGKVREEDAAAAIKVMQDGDILFIDEIHRLGKAGSEWLLTLMQDGALQLRTGVVQAPKITIIAATTEAQKLPRPLLERFPLKPLLNPYTLAEAVEIGKVTAKRLEFGGILPMPASDTWLEAVANASDNNPRKMGMLLTAVRDYALAFDNSNLTEAGYDISTALDWSGLSADGIDRLGQEYLVGLLVSGTTGIKTLQGMLSEERLEHTEADLVRRQYVVVTGRGRELTEYGRERARALAAEMVNTMEKTA